VSGDLAQALKMACGHCGALPGERCYVYAQALKVACGYCGALPGERCYVYDRLIGERWGSSRKPHAARVRAAEAAERAEKEKEKANG
jgi:hypothetical protein